MNIKKIAFVFFSPTHTSKRVGEAIIQGIGISDVCVYDLTYTVTDIPMISSNTLTVVALPVYGGHIPQLAVLRMASLRSEGAPVVAVVVYGNRAYEKALLELDTCLIGKGFKMIAAGTFIGEHSYSSEDYPIAYGRPNKEDLEVAVSFGRRIRAKIESKHSEVEWSFVDVKRIQRPKQPILPLLHFSYEVAKLRRSKKMLPMIPSVDADLCTHCGSCTVACPNGAIIKGDECHTVAERCIRCCACVKRCPQKARSYVTPFAVLLSDNFKQPKENKFIL